MYKIQYINICINEFAKRFGLEPQVSCRYLLKYKALDFLDEHYEAEHVLPLQDTVDSLQMICRRNGGSL